MNEDKLSPEQEDYVKLGETNMAVKILKVLRELKEPLNQECERTGSLSAEQQAQLDLLGVIHSKVIEQQVIDLY